MKTLIFVFPGMMSGIPGWKLLEWLNDTECIMEGKIEELVEKEAIFGCTAFFCMSLHTSSHGDTLFHASAQQRPWKGKRP